MWQSIRQVILETVFPPQCCHCKTLGNLLCNDCYQRLEFIPHAFQPDAKPPLDSISVACMYKGGAKSLIRALKSNRVIGVADTLGWLLYQTCDIPSTSCIAAAPANPKNFILRGFDPALEIAKSLGGIMDHPVRSLLTRTVSAEEQKQLSRQQRQRNLHHTIAFAPNESPPDSVLLVDDVVTTGSTMHECARVLKEAGVKEVRGVAISGA